MVFGGRLDLCGIQNSDEGTGFPSRYFQVRSLESNLI